jgi:hypothetical protein
MSFLGLRALSASAWAVSTLLAVAVAAGLVRLLPWLLAPEVPLEVALPFARALGAQATEMAFLVGLPLGFAWAAATAVDRGEARALAALGASPLSMTVHQVPLAVLAAGLALAALLGWGGSADVPGRFAAQLVAQGKASCARATEPRSASVPLVGVTWLCFPGEPPRVTGALPGMGDRAWFSARALEPSDDLRQVSLTDLYLETRPDSAERRLELHVQSGTVRGLPAWGRSAKLPWVPRALLAAATAFLTALAASWVALRRSVHRRWEALLVGGVPAVCALIALHRLDASDLRPIAYTFVPCIPLLACALLAPWAGRIARSPAR